MSDVVNILKRQLAQKLTDHRKILGVSQLDFGISIGRDQYQVCIWEKMARGEPVPKIMKLETLIETLERCGIAINVQYGIR